MSVAPCHVNDVPRPKSGYGWYYFSHYRRFTSIGQASHRAPRDLLRASWICFTDTGRRRRCRFKRVPHSLGGASDVKTTEKQNSWWKSTYFLQPCNLVWATHSIQTNSCEHPTKLLGLSLQTKCSYMHGQGARSFSQWDCHMIPLEMRPGELQWSVGNHALGGNATIPESVFLTSALVSYGCIYVATTVFDKPEILKFQMLKSFRANRLFDQKLASTFVSEVET